MSKELGSRFNEGKHKWGLVDFEAFQGMVKVLEFGAEKYDAFNWRKGLKVVGICESMLRHTFAYLNGEDIDPESGLPHVAHIQCNAMFLGRMDMEPEMDDRYKHIKT